MKKKIINYTQRQFNEDIVQMHIKIRVYELFHDVGFQEIYGIPRGGIIPGVYLSHRTGIPFTTQLHKTKTTVIIDDISDSGETLQKLYRKHRKSFLSNTFIPFTLWIMNKTAFFPQSFCRVKQKNEWIVYPWEINH